MPVLLCVLLAAAMVAWPRFPADADPRHLFVVIVPLQHPPSPLPLAVPTPAPRWTPPRAGGAYARTSISYTRCYAGTSDYPVSRPEQVG